MKRSLLVTLGLQALLWLGAGGVAQGLGDAPPPLDATAVSVLHSARRVDTYILLDELASGGPGLPAHDNSPLRASDIEAQARYVTTHKLAGGIVVSRGRRGGRPFAQASARAVLDSRVYDRRLLRRCFDPVYVFRLWGGKGSLLVLLDFRCRQMEIVVKDGHGRTVSKVSQTAMGPEFAALARLAGEAFSQDARLRAYLSDA